MRKTVKINPLVVLVSVLVGVELFGLLGALLAIPAAGVLQVIVRDLWDHRTSLQEPTSGADRRWPAPGRPTKERTVTIWPSRNSSRSRATSSTR